MLTHHTGIGLVANFVVLQVLTMFDYYSYDALGKQSLKKCNREEVKDRVFVV